ncbi:MAG: RagB/SusD family nutrient uptake outer membrane protein [Candidatus Cyclobacteriaceae bacterium M3_2C_046]
MKRISLIILLSLVVIVSCDEDNLDIDPVVPTEANYFQDEAQMETGMIGLYSKLVFFYNYRGGSWLHDVRLLPGDDLTSLGGYDFETFEGINAGNGDVSNYFSFAYQLLNRANFLINHIQENGDQVYENDTMKNHHLGEALFLRGYMNLMLWNLFGTAPVVTERITNISDAYVPNSSGTELLDQAINDLEQAKDLLPENWADSFKGRVTADGARGMLGKVYLYRGTVNNDASDHSSAIAAFDEIQNARLMDNFGDNFLASNENNDESLFEIQHGKANGFNNIWLDTDRFWTIGDLGGYWGFFDGHWTLFGNEPFQPTEGLVNTFEAGDPRIVHTFSEDGTAVTKYVIEPGLDNNTYYNNARILRYADVLLMKAEAILESGGNPGDAIALINQVRERARNSGETPSETPADLDLNETDPDLIFQWIMDERRRELAFEEGHRWYDLRRWHLGGKIDLTNWDFGSVRTDFDFQEYNLNLPFPAGELELNSNLQQNEGY